MAYLMVLAKDAAQVAEGEEYVPGTLCSRYRWFFPEMRAEMGDLHVLTGAAKTSLTADPVDAALPGTQSTRGKHREILLHRDSIAEMG